MSNLTDKLQTNKINGRKGLIVYLTAGFPDLAATLEAVLAAADAGADVVEIGIPFSDPIADGPVIQKAAAAALKSGVTTAKILALLADIRRHTAVPLAVMTYINTILNYGAEKFIRDFAQAGMDGVIVPDLPLEECALLQDCCREDGVDLIQFIALTTSADRIASVCEQAGGFIYCISSTGVTGVRSVDYSALAPAIGEARKYTDVPVAIGFGIGTPAAARQAARYADAVIVGSAMVECLEQNGPDGVRELVGSIRRELDREDN